MVKNLPCNAEDVSSISGQETKIPHASEQLSPRASTTEATHSEARVLQLGSPHATAMEACTLWGPCEATKARAAKLIYF